MPLIMVVSPHPPHPHSHSLTLDKSDDFFFFFLLVSLFLFLGEDFFFLGGGGGKGRLSAQNFSAPLRKLKAPQCPLTGNILADATAVTPVVPACIWAAMNGLNRKYIIFNDGLRNGKNIKSALLNMVIIRNEIKWGSLAPHIPICI